MSEATAQTGLSDNAASGLAYITIIPAIIFLVVAPYNQKPAVRFHCWQSIFLGIACVVIDVVLTMIPVVGWIILPLFGLAVLIVWILCIVKAFNGQRFKIPVIGDFAEKQAG
ncbi:MAG: hypothetical protein P4L87_07835, partial [Formivibrio sp.]|nr:hypothetical protein [Formivibrio sp.]